MLFVKSASRPPMALPVEAAARPKPTLARFALDAPVLPLVTDTLRVAEAFRFAAMSQFRRWCQRNPDRAEPFRRTDKPELFSSQTLSGKEPSGAIRKDHRHAFYLPTADGDDPRRITHVTVTAEEGFGAEEVAALSAIRTLRLADERTELRVQLVGLGNAQDFRNPLVEESTVWVSATPFIVTRFPKLRGRKRDRPEDYATPIDFARHVLLQELERLRVRGRALPAILRAEALAGIGPRGLRPIQFQCFRRKPGDDGGRRPKGGFRVVFSAPVRGPILCRPFLPLRARPVSAGRGNWLIVDVWPASAEVMNFAPGFSEAESSLTTRR
jgi:CRISPR-associated protein Csb2